MSGYHQQQQYQHQQQHQQQQHHHQQQHQQHQQHIQQQHHHIQQQQHYPMQQQQQQHHLQMQQQQQQHQQMQQQQQQQQHSHHSHHPIVLTSTSRVDVSEKYTFSYEVGSGTYGMVYKADDKKRHNMRVAIKKFRSTKEGEGLSLTACREIGLLKELSHENIIKLQDICLNPKDKSLNLVFDYAEFDLFGIIKFHRDHPSTPCPDHTIKSLVWQILNGIHYLHSNWVIHRDLKPSNILVMGEGKEYGTVKIGDFGLARIFQSPLRPLHENGVVVTIWYRSPELLLGSKHYTSAVDIWAIGCIFAELITTKPLFPGREKDPKIPSLFQDDQVEKIMRVLGKPTLEMWPDAKHLPEWKKIANCEPYTNTLAKCLGIEESSLAFDLLMKMIQYDPSKRISAQEALDHPYFKEAPIPSANSFGSSVGKILYPTRQQQKKKKDSDE
ncbi:protein serine/threonine kinase [Heterostelium album PN500]|uniref:Protein serine/threonine kinase n=1 Tax=Heterostelium pallidum (strain ATCC 26659 / Pp 5 / PN500) TaxID=670386 RepID=D3AYN1_HETP5|nr:protein serine/threonine kinase [Heterostelium album PN500]EFA86058.1 protein serine/threonine kinase [Heterostelium album PN500]|eukprot:XP_020438164.1 protein serine/threonine kinase [Heterostelium album PN500]